MIDRFRYGCQTGHTLNLARELNRQGIPAKVMLVGMPKHFYREYKGYYPNNMIVPAPSNFKKIKRLVRAFQATLFHFHCPTLLPLAARLTETPGLPFGLTIGEATAPCHPSFMHRASFIIATERTAYATLKSAYPRSYFLPEGIDLLGFRPAPHKNKLIVTFIGEQGKYTLEGYRALLKAIAITGTSLEIVCSQSPPIDVGHFNGWCGPPARAHILAKSQVLIGRGQALLEGMACGNALLFLNHDYRGILVPSWRPAVVTKPCTERGRKPCYRDIFYDLSRLIKDRPYLKRLQEQGRQFVRENHDLRVITEKTANIYSKLKT